MAKIKDYDTVEIDALCNLGKAISSPIRIEIMQLLYEKSMIIKDIAKILKLPASSTAFHLKLLEQAGLIRIEEKPGSRGTTKLCTRKVDRLTIDLMKRTTEIGEVFNVEVPVGGYSSCQVSPTCGLWSTEGVIGGEDMEYAFYLPEHANAGLLWTSSGFVEYHFPNGVPGNKKIKKLSVSMEMCSEAPAYCEDWKSDITVWINGKECGMWMSPGDFGARRGRFMPPGWPDGMTQYGLPVFWEVNQDGSYVNGRKISNITIDGLGLMEQPYFTFRIGNKPDAEHVGGINLFGKHFGDYNQDIIVTMEY